MTKLQYILELLSLSAIQALTGRSLTAFELTAISLAAS
jgi:hypothetical protein